MENNEKIAVEMTAEELEQLKKFREEQQRKALEEKRQKDREAYNSLVDETINNAMPILQSISEGITDSKKAVMEQFKQALAIKGDLFGVKDGQRSHTFTNAEGNKRITLGQYCLDGYRDTVNEGIAMVKEYLASLAKDKESEALVNAVLRLMSKDQAGNLKASRVLQLRKMADDSGNERFQEGVRIIQESYQPVVSKQFIKAEVKDENNEWKSIPLGMTEC